MLIRRSGFESDNATRHFGWKQNFRVFFSKNLESTFKGLQNYVNRAFSLCFHSVKLQCCSTFFKVIHVNSYTCKFDQFCSCWMTYGFSTTALLLLLFWLTELFIEYSCWGCKLDDEQNSAWRIVIFYARCYSGKCFIPVSWKLENAARATLQSSFVIATSSFGMIIDIDILKYIHLWVWPDGSHWLLVVLLLINHVVSVCFVSSSKLDCLRLIFSSLSSVSCRVNLRSDFYYFSPVFHRWFVTRMCMCLCRLLNGDG